MEYINATITHQDSLNTTYSITVPNTHSHLMYPKNATTTSEARIEILEQHDAQTSKCILDTATKIDELERRIRYLEQSYNQARLHIIDIFLMIKHKNK